MLTRCVPGRCALCRECSLDLSGCGLSDACAESLSLLLSSQPSLTWLSLARNAVTAAGAERLFDALADNRTLTALHLHHNRMGHAKGGGSGVQWQCLHSGAATSGNGGCCTATSPLAASLFRCFAGNCGLEVLDVRYCQLSDAAVCALISGIARRGEGGGGGSRLSRLRLSGNFLSAAAGPLFISLLRLRPSVERVELAATGISFRHLTSIAAQCERARVEREEHEPRRLRRLIGHLQRDAVAFKQAARRREQARGELSDIRRRVLDMEGSTAHVVQCHAAERSRMEAALDAERLLSAQSRAVFDAQCRERAAAEAVHEERVRELQATLAREHAQRLAMEQQLRDAQAALEEVVKERPARVDGLRQRLSTERTETERLRVQVTHMRREHSRIAQAVATHQPVPHLLLYTRALRQWYEWEHRQRPPLHARTAEALERSKALGAALTALP